MAMTQLTVQDIVKTGLSDPTFSAANADGHAIANEGDAFIYVKNASGGSIDVTVETPAKVQGVDLEEIVVAVGAGAEEAIRLPSPGIANQVSGALYGTFVTFSAVTSLTIAAMRLV